MTETGREKQKYRSERPDSLANWLGAGNVSGVPSLAPRDVIVFLEMHRERVKGPGCALAIETIARRQNLGRSTVCRSIKCLTGAGVLFSIRRYRASSLRWTIDPVNPDRRRILTDMRYHARKMMPRDPKGQERWIRYHAARLKETLRKARRIERAVVEKK